MVSPPGPPSSLKRPKTSIYFSHFFLFFFIFLEPFWAMVPWSHAGAIECDECLCECLCDDVFANAFTNTAEGTRVPPLHHEAVTPKTAPQRRHRKDDIANRKARIQTLIFKGLRHTSRPQNMKKENMGGLINWVNRFLIIGANENAIFSDRRS